MAGYGDDEAFNAWATAAGHVLEGDLEQARQRGSDYIDAVYGSRFTGVPTAGIDQERAWPRSGATAYGTLIASSVIPNRVITASYEAARLELRKPGSLSVLTDPAKRVKRTKAAAVEVEYFDGASGNASLAPTVSFIDGLLAPLLVSTLAAPAIFVV